MTTMIGIELRGATVLIVGAGPVAARRARGFLDDGAHLRVVAPELSDAMRSVIDHAHETTGDVLHLPRAVRHTDLDGAWLVLTAANQPDVNRQVSTWAHARRIWCINAGTAAQGTARTPASVRTGGMVVGVATDSSAAHATPDPGRIGAVRDAVAELLDSGGADVRRRRRGIGRVVLVGGGPGAVDLMTVRGRQALAQADVVVTDRLGPLEVLDELPADVEIIDVGKFPGRHPIDQPGINQILINKARAGKYVVRLKGGDPFIYGRGGEEVIACREAGVHTEVVPGISSALSVPALAGIPLTHRGTVAAFHVTTGHEGLDAAALTAIRDESATVVVLMGVSKLAQIADQALSAGASDSTPAAIIERGSTPQERIVRAPLADIAERATAHAIRNPAVIVIGAAADPDRLGPTTPRDASAAQAGTPVASEASTAATPSTAAPR